MRRVVIVGKGRANLTRAGARPRPPPASAIRQSHFSGHVSHLNKRANFAAFDPGTFVIGGGVSDTGELLLAPARESFRKTLTGRGHRPEARIERALLGSSAVH